MKNINDMTEDEKREYVQSWVRDLDEFALEEILIEFCGFGDGNSPAMHKPEPPTVRPMSENSKRKLLKDFLEHVEAEIDYLQCEPSILIDSYIESLLPNPNDIKL